MLFSRFLLFQSLVFHLKNIALIFFLYLVCRCHSSIVSFLFLLQQKVQLLIEPSNECIFVKLFLTFKKMTSLLHDIVVSSKFRLTLSRA